MATGTSITLANIKMKHLG